VLATAVAGFAASVAVGLCAIAAGAVVSQRIAGAADAAALAAADTVSGAVSGVPCDRAARIAHVAGLRLVSCEVEGLIATVSVSGSFAGFDLEARARAGPPP
jgi:secretion/DNA translocation related TadE-like protein